MSAFETFDWIVIGSYFLILLVLAWWTIKQRQDTSADYFLAGRHLGWFIVGASIFASNIGSEHLVGLAGTGATDGLPVDAPEKRTYHASGVERPAPRSPWS